MNEKELLKLKAEVEEAKASVAELKGHLQALKNQLKVDWKCNSVEEAEKKLKVMKTEIEKIKQDKESNTKKLEENINYNN